METLFAVSIFLYLIYRSKKENKKLRAENKRLQKTLEASGIIVCEDGKHFIIVLNGSQVLINGEGRICEVNAS